MFRRFTVTFVAKGFMAVGGLLALSIVARLYGADAVGVFALLHTLLLAAALICRLGMDGALMRFAGLRDASVLHIREVRAGLVLPVLASCLLTAFVWLSAAELLLLRFYSADVVRGIKLSAVGLPALTFSLTLAGLLKGRGRPIAASIQENGAVLLIASVLILALNAAGLNEAIVLPASLAASSCLVAVLGAIQLYISYKRCQGKQSYTQIDEGFFKSAVNNFAIGLNRVVGQAGLLLVCSSLLTTHEFGLLASAERSAIVVGFALIVTNAFFPRQISIAYAQGGMASAAVVARQASMLGTALALPVLLVICLKPDVLALVYGPEFIQAHFVFLFLSLAHFVAVITGPALILLTLTGHEGAVRNIGLASSLVALLALFSLVPSYGVLGAGIGIGAGLLLNVVGTWAFMGRIHGHWIRPINMSSRQLL